MVRTLAVAGTPEECAAEISRRFGDVAERVCAYFPGYDAPLDQVGELAEGSAVDLTARPGWRHARPKDHRWPPWSRWCGLTSVRGIEGEGSHVGERRVEGLAQRFDVLCGLGEEKSALEGGHQRGGELIDVRVGP